MASLSGTVLRIRTTFLGPTNFDIVSCFRPVECNRVRKSAYYNVILKKKKKRVKDDKSCMTSKRVHEFANGSKMYMGECGCKRGKSSYFNSEYIKVRFPCFAVHSAINYYIKLKLKNIYNKNCIGNFREQ